MPKVHESVIKENYLLRSTFFYNSLRSEGYFELFTQLKKYSKIEGGKLNWDNRSEWHIGEDAWKTIADNRISPILIFLHPKVLQLNPNVESMENGKVEAGRLSSQQIEHLICCINETVSMLVSLASDISEKNIEGMMYATAGTKIDGSWRNSIGAEGERVIRTIIFNELFSHNEISSIADKKNQLTEIIKWKKTRGIEDIKTIYLVNGYSILFSSEPDVTLYNENGAIVGVIEIKSGLDPAGALERLGAMFKSFENTLAEYPAAVTILIASCITDEVESRLGTSMLVRQKYITTNITSNEHEKHKFVNRLRTIMKLANVK